MKRGCVIGCSVVGVLALLALAGLAIYLYPLVAAFAPVACAEAADYVPRVDLPEYATLLDESCSTSFNPSYQATFTIPSSQLAAYQAAQPQIGKWVSSAEGLVMYAQEAAGMRSFLACTHSDGAYATEILIDTSDPERYTVYYHRAFID